MSKTILIVEDNDVNMRLFTDILEMHAHTVLQATDGPKGLAIAREHRPDLILMDVQLPGMSGLDVTTELKRDAALRHIPVVALTAFAMKGDEERIRQAGCDGYLSKPIRLPAFLETVRRYIDHGSPATEQGLAVPRSGMQSSPILSA